MENRRYFTLFLLFAATWFIIAPRLFPGLFPQPPKPQPQVPVLNPELPKVDAPANGQPEAPTELATHPARTVVLGPPADDKTPPEDFFLRVTTTTRGAAVEFAELLNPKYTNLERTEPLKIVGHLNGEAAAFASEMPRTLQTSIPDIDRLLAPHQKTLATVDWEVVPGSESNLGVTYRYVSPDGSLEVRKKYELRKGNPELVNDDVTGYLLGLEVTVENKSDKTQSTRYRMIGPAGMPMEDPNNARTFIELKAGTIENAASIDDVDAVSLTAATALSQIKKVRDTNDPSALTVWRKPLRYAGADVQYFAALLVPRENQAADSNNDQRPDAYFSEARPVVFWEDRAHPERSDVALEFTSTDLELAPGASKTHQFDLFLGPKRSHLLEKIGAEPVMNYGWWRIISRALMAILNFFHNFLHAPYWLAIILLTVVVRGAMFPVSLKQTAGAQKMKELQPELQELRKKFTKEPEKFAIAQRELFRKHHYNPLGGCLPVFLQLPIFIGLYNALYYAVDLRLARFLWVDNLAAPDALMRFKGELPFLGWNELNILPLITVALFLVQQKMFMPPPTSDETRLQNRMMNFMTVFMGFLFYKSPAGLCIYFTASSLWGICERKILDRMKPRIEARAAAKRAAKDAKRKDKGDSKGWYDRLLEAADDARKQTGNGRTRPGDSKESERSGRGR